MCLWGKTYKHTVLLVLCYCFVHGAVAFNIQQKLDNFVTLISTKPSQMFVAGWTASTSIGLDKKKIILRVHARKGRKYWEQPWSVY